MRAAVGILVVVLSGAFCCAGAGEEFRWSRLTAEDGLADCAMTVAVQDQQGFMWFGTKLGGLHRYDGYEFKVYQYENGDGRSLSHNYVSALLVGGDGSLWVGTERGLNRYDRDRDDFSHFYSEKGAEASFADNQVRALSEGAGGVLWVATVSGLSRLDREGEKLVSCEGESGYPRGLSGANIRSLFFDGETKGLWVATGGSGIYVLDEAGHERRVYRHEPGVGGSLSSNNVACILRDRSGVLWVATDSGLNRFVAETEKFVQYWHDEKKASSLTGNYIWEVLEDSKGRFWVATSMGLDLMDRERGVFLHLTHDPDDPGSLSNWQIPHLYEDRSGGVWALTTEEGINRLAGEGEKFRVYQHNSGGSGLLDDSVRAVFVDHTDRMWVGGMQGVSCLEGGRFRHYLTEKDGRHASVLSITEDAKGQVWVGSWPEGLFRFDGEGFSNYLNDWRDTESPACNNIWTMVGDATGGLWISYWGYCIDHFDGKRFGHYWPDPEYAENIILSCARDSKGIIWFGGRAGLTRLDPATKMFRTVVIDPEHPGNEVNRSITCVYADRGGPGEIWVGTQSGLYQYDADTERFSLRCSRKEGLPCENVLSIQRDDQGCLWLGTTLGLSRYDPVGGGVRSYDVSDGLPGNKFFPNAASRSSDGRMYFGGIGGVVSFDPEAMPDNRHVPPVVLTGFELFNKPVAIGREDSPLRKAVHVAEAITLSHFQTSFTLKFAALNYTLPGKNRYAYKMEGFDEDWRYTDARRRFASYTNLNAGEYTFRVRGSNNDGLWNKEGASLRVLVLPPWWATWWFRGMLVFLTGGLAFGGYRWRVSAITRRAAELEREVAQRTQSLSERTGQLAALAVELSAAEDRERRHLAEVLHEDLQQMLVAAQFQLAVMAKETGGGAVALEAFKRVEGMLQGCVEKTRTLSHDLSPPTLRQRGLISALQWQAERMQLRHGLLVTIDADGGAEPRAESLRAFLFKAVSELLFNVVKHAGVQEVAVMLRHVDGELKVTVEDAGKGFDPGVVFSGRSPRGFGLLSIRERLGLLGGRLDIRSVPGEGSRFELVLPDSPGGSSPEQRHGRWRASAAVGEAVEVAAGVGVSVGGSVVRVVLADDHRSVREGLARLLEGEPGVEVVGEADNGKEAVDLTRHLQPHIVVMDVSMPVMNGIEATRLIKRDFPRVRVVGLSMFDQEDMARGMLEAGAEAYVCKSGPSEDLVVAIRGGRQWLGGAVGRDLG